jgi:hypothetical protein
LEAEAVISSWREEARRELAQIKASSSGWSYRHRGTTCVEPTVLASLALLASGDAESRELDLGHGQAAGLWLRALQRPDGRVPVSATVDAPGWSTPLAIVLWQVVSGHKAQRDRAARWLTEFSGTTDDRGQNQQNGSTGKGRESTGWPWVEGTHSWIEPTAMAVLALCGAGFGEHERVGRGIQLIADLALPHGGWNCGNKIVFGRELRPQPVPTALSLLALAARRERSQAAVRGVDYLRQMSTALRSPVSLGWSLLALRAYGAIPAEADALLLHAFRARPLRSDCDPVRSLALLLLASADPGVSMLLLPAPTEPFVALRSAQGRSLAERKARYVERCANS